MRIVVALVGGLAVLCACRASEKPPSVDQLVSQLRSPDTRQSGEARLQLIRLGEPAVPALSELLRSGQPAERIVAANTLWGMGPRARAAAADLGTALGETDTQLRLVAAMALENMGASAEPAVPALIRAVGDREAAVRQAAVKALGAIGPAASASLPTLTRTLRRSSWPEAEEAVRRIKGLAPGARLDLGAQADDAR